MRKFLIPVVLALAVASPGLAFAAGTTAPVAKPMAVAATSGQSISSTVKSFDMKTHMLTLANGVAYTLPATFKDPGLKVGEKVTVHWKMNGIAHDATDVTIG